MRLIGIMALLFSMCAGRAQHNLNDFTVVLHEETINKVFQAIGEIKGSNEYKLLLITGHYNWKINNPSISIRPDSSQFHCTAFVQTGPFAYTSPVTGDVKISYVRTTNKIQVTISRAVLELYTVVLGKKIHIKYINLADYFKEPFLFDGPQSAETNFEFTMPDSTVKRIYLKPSDCDMEIRWKEIVSHCEVTVADKPFEQAAQEKPPLVQEPVPVLHPNLKESGAKKQKPD